MDPAQTGAGVESLFSFLENQAALSFAPSGTSCSLPISRLFVSFCRNLRLLHYINYFNCLWQRRVVPWLRARFMTGSSP